MSQDVPGSELVDYVVVVAQGHALDLQVDARLRSRLKVVQRNDTCLDGFYVHRGLEAVDHRLYSYFVLVDSSVRGPFLPLYFLAHAPWVEALTSLITNSVKLVGPTINCAPSVHVQATVLATDSVGLNVLLRQNSFACHAAQDKAFAHFVVGSSQSILQAGYTLKSLQLRYRNLDFRNATGCNGMIGPNTDMSSDGLSLEPFEVLFVESKKYRRSELADFVAKYTDYMLERRDYRANDFYGEKVSRHFVEQLDETLKAAAMCLAVFDHAFYAQQNPDLAVLGGAQTALLDHFQKYGFKEGRPSRWVATKDTPRSELCSFAERV
ncbi:hypothetical protein TSOC_004894 [Tetrabaena socialis]|uniref:Uncharacterized protein n=1 Tax=Tetrabaena socialis TaxID=47790 RepID=A0A2J8A7M5_9CHLO|nr:hypothetical protein TSOC_004894 [Tetrabaena socialis]|eukprot:PNH08539.1 hypothetical protein TSOC_004894 [Tetrabaena socialis]